MKFSRPLSLILVLLFIFPLSLTCFASSDNNLIDSDLTNWENLIDSSENYYTVTASESSSIYRLTLEDASPSIYYGLVLTESTLVAGHSYSLSFRLPSRSECNSAYGNSYSSSVYENHFKNCVVTVGTGAISPSGEFSFTESSVSLNINKDNYSKYFGKDITLSFVAENYVGTPVVFIWITSLDSGKHTFYFSDFKLVDNDDNKAELDGIKGFLHNIYYGIVGGNCDEACSPHKSLAQRIGEALSGLFEDISDGLDTLGTYIGQALSNGLGSLGNLILYFDIDGDYQNPFEGMNSPLDKLNSFFDNLNSYVNNVGQSIENMLDSITGSLEIFNRFTNRFPWLHGIAVFCLALIVLTKVIGL